MNAENWVERELLRELQRIKHFIESGDALNFSDYRYHCGQIRGIQFCMQAMKDAQDQAIREEGD